MFTEKRIKYKEMTNTGDKKIARLKMNEAWAKLVIHIQTEEVLIPNRVDNRTLILTL